MANDTASWFSGPHYYSNVTYVGKMNGGLGNGGVGLTPDFVYNEGLLHYPTPWIDTGAVATGDIKFAALGWVQETVDPTNLSVTNTTTIIHSLYPGDVMRQVVQVGDNIYIVTYGNGSGLFPGVNEDAAPPLWTFTDNLGISRVASLNFATSPLSYNGMWANTTAADIAEAGGNVRDAVLANQADFALPSALTNRARVLGTDTDNATLLEGVAARNPDGTNQLTPERSAQLEAAGLVPSI
jgi:hypothetical protein